MLKNTLFHPSLLKIVLLLCIPFVQTMATSDLNPKNTKGADATIAINQSPQQKTVGSSIPVTGIVTDEEGETLPGVGVTLKSKKLTGTVTGINGEFAILVTDIEKDVLVFSYVGMETQEVKTKKGTLHYKITLAANESALKEVVVEAGIIQRDKMGFTGAYTSVTGDELKAMGNQNVFLSLRSLDPSFVIMDNNVMGSNPNTLSDIEIRGQTTLDLGTVRDDAEASPNAPLFVIDGFIATQREVQDLDMNRVASLTILKDAGSTAIYGSKGANGVIVVETIKSKGGALMVRYNADLQVSFADLGVYNMMNSSEKLEFERLAGKYGAQEGSPMNNVNNITKMDIYYKHLADIERGVDTYWLNEAVRTGITQKHSVSISGGADEINYQVGTNYGKEEGVMKDDFRETFAGYIKLTYRLNKLSVSNNLSISGANSQESPYAPFSDFVRANPYFQKRDAQGIVPMYLEETDNLLGITSPTPNPLYNALLDSRDESNYITITNNTGLNWSPVNDLLFMASLSLNRTTTDATQFTDSDDTRYAGRNYKEKGNYYNRNTGKWGYSANASVNYARSFDESHNFTLIGRTSIDENNNKAKSFEAQGFPSGSNGIPSFAYSYKIDSRPTYSELVTRSVNGVGVFNYNYKYRYLFDANYTVEGSSNFGSNKKFAAFWSLGAGWNIQKEDFAKDWKWMSNFKVSTTYGLTANQNRNLITSSVYGFYSGNTIFGQGSYLSSYNNPDLQWEKVKNLSLNFDTGFLNNRLKVYFSAYDKKTDPMTLPLAQRPSSGIGTYSINMGYMKTKGAELRASYSPIYNLKDRIILTVRAMGSSVKSTYGGFGNALESLNNEFKTEANPNLSQKSLRQFKDGGDPFSLWAVRSLGIDPTTGRELFLKADGVTQTFLYSANDRVVIASSRPTMEGTVGLSFTYKKLEISTAFRYRFGGYTYNSAIYNTVENISSTSLAYNQDKRALYDRWKNPGDMAQFTSLQIVGSAWVQSPTSSRFIQKDNSISGESLTASWDFSKDKWITNLKLKELKLTFYMLDVFRVSTIKTERGTSYPFARNVSFSLSTRF